MVILFGTGFLFVGVIQLHSIFYGALFGYWRTRSEVTVPARLQSVELRVQGGGRGGSSAATVVNYTYYYHDSAFTGRRVSLFQPSGGFYSDLAAKLKTGTLIRVFVDPKNPKFSVIDREFSWWPLINNRGSVFDDICRRRLFPFSGFISRPKIELIANAKPSQNQPAAIAQRLSSAFPSSPVRRGEL